MKTIFKNTFALLTPGERQQFYYLISFDIIISILDIASLALMLFVINFYSQPPTQFHSAIWPDWFNNNQSLFPVLAFLVFYSAKNLLGYQLQKLQYRFAYHVAARLSREHFLKYLEGHYSAYASIDSSVHIRKISQYPVEFAHYVLAGMQQVFTQAVLIITALVAVCWYDAQMFVLLTLLLMPPVMAIAFLVKKRTKTARANIKSTGEKTLQYLKEGLAGYIESNIYDRHLFFTDRYAGWQQRLNDHLSRLQSIQGLSGRLLEIFAVLGLFILIVLNKWNGDGAAVNIITVGTFMAAAYKIMPGVVKILNSSGQIRTYSYAINELLCQERNQPVARAHSEAGNIHSIEFKNVDFGYEGNPLLRDLNLKIEPGDCVGISGLSGKGKTSLLNLLLAFSEQDAGEIRINDAVADKEKRQLYRRHISYVKQQPFVIHDSILKNITLDENTIDPGKLDAAVTAAGLKELVDSFADGLNKLVTENGKNISGGQRQRIVIARALYKNADLIILDEPFSELDKASELAMLGHFAALARNGKMVMLISHNMETLSFCNKLISLDEK